ncbi:DUF3667 domain-containing protein [Rhodocytophaga rosea]|uniref:DUF3667 domain-containing protein n=1 Tax=Rhodocytophaga rosea TaxID=2704465 RepID=A0A6C0GGI7_9BACT|nr:DUF3667 domain-containing protein [Rhodocytophaga rosea]QHT66790.1 DUF3667 domain-containing protein [Rhodocytophaga rosea]
MHVSHTCKSCGNIFAGKYCNSCGEKRIEPADLSIWHYVSSIFQALTSTDHKLWRTLKVILMSPGTLSRYYMEGRRIQYLTPVSIFFLANLIYFLIPYFETFNSSLHTQTHLLPHSKIALEMVNEYLEKHQLNEQEFRKMYEAKSTETAKLLLIALVMLTSLPIGLINFRKQPYISGHITFAFETVTFNLLVNTIALSTLAAIVVYIAEAVQANPGFFLNDRLFSFISAGTNFYFLYTGERNFYACTRAGSIWRATAMIMGIYSMLTLYRILLFFITFFLL